MNYNLLLENILGPRKFLYAIECPVCGHDEVYYLNPITNEQLGRACENCHYIQKFNF